MFFGYQEVLYPHWQTKLTSLQELTIGGSLAVVVLDVIRHQLLHDGINLGLLSSGLSFNVLNFLWSPDQMSAGVQNLAVFSHSSVQHSCLNCWSGFSFALHPHPAVAEEWTN
jgi:hypothetical protein